MVQRCGDDVAGGAERLCRDTAREMSQLWDCEILTTCARDARSWHNAYAAGTTEIGGVFARRFPTDRERNPRDFERRSRRVRRGDASRDELERWMRAQGPDSSALEAYVREHAARYDRFVFYSYLYATTYFNLPLVAERATLVPLAHDEWMLSLPLFERVFRSGVRIACVSEDERELVQRRFPGIRACDELVAPGIDVPPVEPERFRAERRLDVPFVVCVGRVEAAKGTGELLAHFAAYKRSRPGPRRLVLVGPIAMRLPESDDIIALGRLEEREKWNAVAAADYAIVPSAYESLSIVMLEAWAVGKAVVANGTSSVLVGQCRRANAGLWYANESEFVELLATNLLGHAAVLGANGAKFVAERYRWERTRTSMLAATALA